MAATNELSGWHGKRVHNVDGRHGRVASVFNGWAWHELRIECADGSKAEVQLNVLGKDGGELGWRWLSEDFHIDGQPAPSWLPLGDHNAPGSLPLLREAEVIVPASTPVAAPALAL